MARRVVTLVTLCVKLAISWWFLARVIMLTPMVVGELLWVHSVLLVLWYPTLRSALALVVNDSGSLWFCTTVAGVKICLVVHESFCFNSTQFYSK